ncbi:hypothetical protein M8J76_003697 [Diaphorina citri]|nr:hypothetical protein M8J76_003697 [Diaphorina citri]
MISSLSKYFYKTCEEDQSLNGNTTYKEEQKTLNIESIKTTDFLRKLRKIDSTENILNLVQVTEYKKTPRRESRQSKSKKKLKNINTDPEKDEVLENTGLSTVTDTTSRTKEQSECDNMANPTKISRKEKGENINFLSKQDDKTSSYESVVNEMPLERKPSNEHIPILLAQSNSELKKELNEISQNPQQIKKTQSGEDIFFIDSSCYSPFNLKCKLMEKKDNLVLSTSKSDLKTNIIPSTSKSNLGGSSVQPKVSNSFFEFKFRTEIDEAESEPITDRSSKLCVDSESLTELMKKQLSSVSLEKKLSTDVSLARLSSIPSIPSSSEYTNSGLETPHNSSKIGNSVEKIVKQINLQAASKTDIRDKTDSDFEETAVLFTRESKSNDSIYSKRLNLETSKIPILTRLDNVNHPVQTKLEETLNDNDQARVQVKETSSSENTTSLQGNKNASQISKRDNSSHIKPESNDSHKTLKAKSATPKRLQLRDQKSKENKNMSIVTNTIITEVSDRGECEETNLNNQIDTCKALKEEIMGKINEYEKSIQKVYKLKNDLISNPKNIPSKNMINQCFLNDDTVNIISKANAVEKIQLKERLADPESYVNNATEKVKEELKNYYNFVQSKIREAYSENRGMKTTNVNETLIDTERELELKNQEIANSVCGALNFIADENQSLSQYCKELIKTNDECNEKLMEKLIWLEKENENLSMQIFNWKKSSSSNKTRLDDLLEEKKKDGQISDIMKMYNDIEMKNNYHAQLVENFMKSVKMIEIKIEHHSKHLESKAEKTASQMAIAEMKRTSLEETIEHLKQRLDHSQREFQELTNKVNEFRKNIFKLKNKNKALSKELIKYKYPVHLEKNIQKMIALRNLLVRTSEGALPVQDTHLLDIMRSIDTDEYFPMLDTPSSYVDSFHQMNSISTTSNELLMRKSTHNTLDIQPTPSTTKTTHIRDHGESLSNVQFSVRDISPVGSANIIDYNLFG